MSVSQIDSSSAACSATDFRPEGFDAPIFFSQTVKLVGSICKSWQIRISHFHGVCTYIRGSHTFWRFTYAGAVLLILAKSLQKTFVKQFWTCHLFIPKPQLPMSPQSVEEREPGTIYRFECCSAKIARIQWYTGKQTTADAKRLEQFKGENICKRSWRDDGNFSRTLKHTQTKECDNMEVKFQSDLRHNYVQKLMDYPQKIVSTADG